MNKKNKKNMNWRNSMMLSTVSYAIYTVFWIVLDDDAAPQLSGMTAMDYLVDFLLCMLFTNISLGFCHLLFNAVTFKASYSRTLIFASCLLILNNMVAFGMTSLFNLLWGETDNRLMNELINMKGAYTFAMIATFISSVYANTFYLQSYIKTRDEKQVLEMALMKENETALQSQINALKLQINPHFMFNSFNNLMELIEEDTVLAGKFLGNLSKVYRYITANLDRDLIPVKEEIRFLESYLYLMKIRHSEGVIARISPEIKVCSGKSLDKYKGYKGLLPVGEKSRPYPCRHPSCRRTEFRCLEICSGKRPDNLHYCLRRICREGFQIQQFRLSAQAH